MHTAICKNFFFFSFLLGALKNWSILVKTSMYIFYIIVRNKINSYDYYFVDSGNETAFHKFPPQDDQMELQ